MKSEEVNLKFNIGDIVVHSSMADKNHVSLLVAARMTVIGIGSMRTSDAEPEPLYLVSHFDGDNKLCRAYLLEAEIVLPANSDQK